MKFEGNPIKNDLVRVTTDRQMDGQAENNRAPPTFVGGALIKDFFQSPHKLHGDKLLPLRILFLLQFNGNIVGVIANLLF